MKKTTTSELILSRAGTLRWDVGENVHDVLLESIYKEAARIADRTVIPDGRQSRYDWDRMLDRVLTSRWTGFPIMLLILTVVFWVTITGANVPPT